MYNQIISCFRILVAIGIMASSNFKGWSQQKSEGKMDLYILMGQSNMAGRGSITDDIRKTHHDNVFALSKEYKWLLARHPLHFDKPGIAAAGPGLTFGIKMAEANPKVRVGLVPCAVGGTSIEKWQPGAYDSITRTHPYDDAVARIRLAMTFGTVKGVIWHQGEANSTPEKAAAYLDQLKELISRVRTLVGNPDLPFIAGELGRFYKGADNINTQLAKLPGVVAHTAVVSSLNLNHKGDEVHFDGASAEELGRRYADVMLKMQKFDVPKPKRAKKQKGR